MKRALTIILVLSLITGSASAMTVAQFVDRYNQNKGKGCNIVADKSFVSDDVAILTRYEERDIVAVVTVPSSADRLEDCTIISVALKHKPRCDPSVYLTNIAAAVAAVYPEISEEERLAEIYRTLRQSEYFFGNGYWAESPVPYNTEHMGQFVYQEENSYYTFLFSFSEDRP